MARKPKKHHEEHEAGEAWLLPYSDLMTLLLAVFIVLFAVNKSDPAKLDQMAAHFQGILDGGTGILNQGTSIFESDLPGFQKTPGTKGEDGVEGTGGAGATPEQIQDLTDTFKSYVAENELTGQMQITETDLGLIVTLTSDIWFPPGSAAITQVQADIAKEIGAMITESQSKSSQLNVIVTGHTDNMPIHNAQFKSNWHLSVARAVNFMEALIDNSELDPANYSARGLGEYEPIDTNETSEGRQHNRRVEVYISTAGGA